MPNRPAANLAQLLAINAHQVWLRTMTHPAPAAQQLHERLNQPQPGDLVVEISSRSLPDDVAVRLGWLVRVESVHGLRIWTIETLDGRQVHWQNAQFIVVLQEEP